MSPLFDIFVLRQGWAIAVADILRVVCLIGGFALAALYLRAWLGRGVEHRVCCYPGFQESLAALALFAIFACLTEFDQLDEPVTILLPVAFVAMGLAVAGLYALPAGREVDKHEDWLKGDET